MKKLEQKQELAEQGKFAPSIEVQVEQQWLT